VDSALTERLVTAGVMVGVAIVIWIVGRWLQRKLPEQWGRLVGQLIPVLILAVLAIGALILIDPGQASQLSDDLFSAVPTVIVAVLIVIIARALGKISGQLIETGLHRISPALAGRARLFVSGLILGIGLVIALQWVGVSTDIILVLVAALAFGSALAVALSVGLGSVPVARHVAAGRHVNRRYAPGDTIRVGDVEGVVVEVGLSTTRIRVSDHREIDVPNADFLDGSVTVES
jgi:small-conductance mechanosensitive channel